MSTTTKFLSGAVLSALLGLVIPYWFMPFISGLCLGVFFNGTLGRKLILTFAVHWLICTVFCWFIHAQGGSDLIQRIAGVFGSQYPWLIIFISSVFYGFTASSGTIIGHVSVQWFTKK